MEIDKKVTIPILRCDEKRPRIGLSTGASFFAAFGGISSCMKRNERSSGDSSCRMETALEIYLGFIRHTSH